MECKKNVIFVPIMAVILFLGFGSAAPAQDMDLTTNEPVVEKKTVELPPLLPSRGCKILWDTSKGVYLGYAPSDYYSTITAILESKGYIMDENDQGVLNVNLDEYGIIVIACGSAWNDPYTADEAAVIGEFVQNGGGLLIMGENPACPNYHLNPVAETFGTTCGLSYIDPTVVTNFANHPVFNDIAEIYTQAGGEIESNPPSEEIAWYMDLGMVAAAEVGLGRVIITGDSNPPDNSYITYSDNQLFSENVFNWLCPAAGCLLSADTDELSARDGGVINFTLKAGDENGMRGYLLLGCVSGTDPGTLLPGGAATLPLNLDYFTDVVVALMNTSLFMDFMGDLDASGNGAAQMAVEGMGAVSQGCIGKTLHFAYALYGPWDCASNAVGIEIVE
jgi:hypothetical protein